MKTLLSKLFASSILLLALASLSACAPFNVNDFLPSFNTDASESVLNNPRAHYTISSSADTLRSFALEDALLVFINGQATHEYYGNVDKSLLEPVSFEAHIGSSIYVQVANAGFGSSCGVDDLYLHKEGGSSQPLLIGFHYDLCQNGVIFTSETVTLE